MAKLEREYNVPLRREFNKVPRYRRANKAMTALKAFIAKHMKADEVKVGEFLNLKMWKNGIKNPPHKVEVKATKNEDGVVTVELRDLPKIREKVNKKLNRTLKSADNAAKKAEEDAKKKAAKKAQIQKDIDAKRAEKAAATKAEEAKSADKPAKEAESKSEEPKTESKK